VACGCVVTNLTSLTKTYTGCMSAATTLPSVDFSEAKAHLSDLMSAVVRQRQPRLVRRHRGKEAMLLVRPEDLARALSAFRFEPQVVHAEGETTVALEQLGVLGFGETFEAAIEDAVEELRAYAQRYFEDAAFYAKTDRADHWPWLLRFVLTPPERQRELLLKPPYVLDQWSKPRS
jgi:hypothetical protein